MSDMKMAILCNAISCVAGSTAIAIACKVTKSALPLLAFPLIPRWGLHVETNDDKKEEGEES